MDTFRANVLNMKTPLIAYSGTNGRPECDLNDNRTKHMICSARDCLPDDVCPNGVLKMTGPSNHY